MDNISMVGTELTFFAKNPHQHAQKYLTIMTSQSSSYELNSVKSHWDKVMCYFKAIQPIGQFF